MSEDLLSHCDRDRAMLDLHRDLMRLHMAHMTDLLKQYDLLAAQIQATWLIAKERLMQEAGPAT